MSATKIKEITEQVEQSIRQLKKEDLRPQEMLFMLSAFNDEGGKVAISSQAAGSGEMLTTAVCAAMVSEEHIFYAVKQAVHIAEQYVMRKRKENPEEPVK
jgi:hydroxymethylpyrimidine/phosphomethylpyrimidine kinase